MSVAEPTITTFEANYTLKRDDSVVGKIQRSVSLKEGVYSFHSSTKTTGLVALFYKNNVDEQTSWEMHNGEFKPIHYKYFRDKNGKIKTIEIDFDWPNQRIITHAKGSHWTMPLESGIYDKLLYEIVIMNRLQQGQATTDFQVADGGKIKTYSFKHLGTETINTSIGALKTIKLERHKSNTDKTLNVWYAIDKNYLPVKVENIDSEGKTVTAIINGINFH